MGIFCPCCPAFWDDYGILSYTCMQSLFATCISCEDSIHMGIFCPCCPAFWDNNGLLSYTCMQCLCTTRMAMRTASMRGTPAPVAQLSGTTMESELFLHATCIYTMNCCEDNIHVGYSCPGCPALWDSNGLLSNACMSPLSYSCMGKDDVIL